MDLTKLGPATYVASIACQNGSQTYHDALVVISYSELNAKIKCHLYLCDICDSKQGWHNYSVILMPLSRAKVLDSKN